MGDLLWCSARPKDVHHDGLRCTRWRMAVPEAGATQCLRSKCALPARVGPGRPFQTFL